MAEKFSGELDLPPAPKKLQVADCTTPSSSPPLNVAPPPPYSMMLFLMILFQHSLLQVSSLKEIVAQLHADLATICSLMNYEAVAQLQADLATARSLLNYQCRSTLLSHFGDIIQSLPEYIAQLLHVSLDILREHLDREFQNGFGWGGIWHTKVEERLGLKFDLYREDWKTLLDISYQQFSLHHTLQIPPEGFGVDDSLFEGWRLLYSGYSALFKEKEVHVLSRLLDKLKEHADFREVVRKVNASQRSRLL